MKTAPLFTAIICCLLSLICAPRTLAQPQGRGGTLAERFRRFDRNGDGKVTKVEAGGAVWFERFDRDSDGVVTLREVLSWARDRGNRGSKQADGLKMPPEPPLVSHLDIEYAKMEGVDPNLLSSTPATA